jgi:hypothetical protein
MNFLYAVPHDRTINETKDYMAEARPSDIIRYRNELNYEISRLIYDDKAEFLKEFTDRFSMELSGQIWNLDEIVKRYRTEEKV